MKKEVVITGMGVLSPIGNTLDDYWQALCEGKSGVGVLSAIQTSLPDKPYGSELSDFSPKDYVKPKKNIKVMSRDIQMGFVAVALACANAGLILEGDEHSVDPERMGVVFGCDLIALDLTELIDAFKVGISDGKYDYSTWGTAAMAKIMPLWMLKYLPNMPACHIGIALDARGPNNTPTLERASSLSAMIEAAHVIERGDADVMVCGGCGNKVNPAALARSELLDMVPSADDLQSQPRPFDAQRRGTILGEGSGAFVLESKEFALARGAKPIATILGSGRTMAPARQRGTNREGIARSIREALADGSRTAADIDHVNVDGLCVVYDDAEEAAAVRETLGDTPVFSAKGHFGNLGSGTGAVELVASLLGLQHGTIPATRNCDQIADDCPVNVIKDGPHAVNKPAFLKLNHTNMGRSVAALFEKF